MVPSRACLPLAFLALSVAAASVHAAPPPDAFCVILIEALDGFHQVLVTVDLETNLTQREAAFAAIDRDGNGTVTPAESEAFRVAGMRVWDDPADLGNRSVALRVNGQRGTWLEGALYATTWTQVGHTFHKQNHTQPAYVREPVDLETQEVRDFRFGLEGEAEVALVTLQGGDRPYQPPPGTTTVTSSSTTQTVAVEYVVVRAPAGWLVEHVEGYGYEGRITMDPRLAEVDLPAFDTKKPFELTFIRDDPPPNTTTTTVTETEVQRVTITAEPDDRGAPAGSPLFLALALGVAAAVLLRRRL